MAEVYLARDDHLDRDVALKVLKPQYADEGELVERFRREARSAASLSHPNIVSVYDRGETEDGTYYIVMEYLSRGTLAEHISRKGSLSSQVAVEVAIQVAEALKAAHGKGVIHRDIKPQNILITESGDVKVTDFGIARAASSTTLTRTGVVLGSVYYMSPEQAMGGSVGPASDLYSLGVVLYQMLTGRRPYEAENPLEVVMKHVNGQLRSPDEVNHEVPENISLLTLKLLAKDPADRYPSAADLVQDLLRVKTGASLTPTHLKPSRLIETKRQKSKPEKAPTPPDTTKDKPHSGVRKRARRVITRLVSIVAFIAVLIGLVLVASNALPYLWHHSLIPKYNLTVPDLRGEPFVKAEWSGVRSRFYVTADRREGSNKPQGTLIEQNPLPNTQAAIGSDISVVLSSGPRQQTKRSQSK